MAKPEPGERNLRRLHLWQIQGVRDVLLVCAVLALLWVGYAMRAVTVPVLVAFGLAYLVEPLVQKLTRDGRMRRPLAVMVILVVAGVCTVLATMLAVPVVWNQTNALMEEIRTRRVQQFLSEAEQTLPAGWREPVAKLSEWLREAETPEIQPSRAAGDGSTSGAAPAGISAGADGAMGTSGAIAMPSPPHARTSGEMGAAPPGTADANAASPPRESEDDRIRRIVAEQVQTELASRGISAPAAPVSDIPFSSLLGAGVQQVLSRAFDLIALLFLAFLVPFYFYFFSVSYPDAIKFLEAMIPQGRRERVRHLAGEMDHAVSGFVRGRIVIAFLMGVMAALGWKFCGVPYAITLGLAAGVLSIVPYLGFAAVPVAMGMLLLDQVSLPTDARMQWYWILGGPLLVFVIVQSIEGYLLTPIIAGKVTDLGPVTIFVAVLAGASLAGVYGMLLSIPAAACIKIWWREVMLPRIKEWSAGRRSDPLPLDSE